MFKFDHVFPGGNGNGGTGASVTAVLYGELGTASFKELHLKLVELATAGDVTYVLRHYLKVGR